MKLKKPKIFPLAGFIGEKKNRGKKTPPDVLGSEIKYQCFIFYGPYNQKKNLNMHNRLLYNNQTGTKV